MGIVFRQSVKSAIVTFAGALLGATVIYLSTLYIPLQELGFFRNTLPEQALLIAQILLLGLHSTLSVYIHKYTGDDLRRKVLLSICFLIPLLALLLLFPFYYLFRSDIVHFFRAEDILLVDRYYYWLPVFTLLFIFLLLLEQYMISQMKVALAVFMREVVLRLLLILLIVLFGLDIIGFDILLPASVLVYIIPVILLFFFSNRTGNFGFTARWQPLDKAARKDIVAFTWYHFLLGLSLNLLNKLDIILLAMWAGLSAGAVYGIAVYILSFLFIPYRTMVNASLPVLTQAYHAGDTRKVKDIYSRSSLNILIAVTGLAILIAGNIHNAAAILDPEFADIVPLTAILIVGRVVDMATGMSEQLLSISNYYRFSFFLSLFIVLLLIAGNYLLIPLYGYFGAAATTCAALIIYSIFKTGYIRFRLLLSPFSGKTLLVLLCAAPAVAAGYLIPNLPSPLTDVLIRSAAIICLYGGLLVWLRPSADLNQYLASIIRNKRLF